MIVLGGLVCVTLMAAPELSVAREGHTTIRTRAGDLELVTRRPALHGLPVRGAYTTQRTALDGVELPVASRLPASPPRRLPDEARITAHDVPALVHAQLGVWPHREPTLVYVLVLGEPVLAWEVALPLALDPVPSLRTVWLSARSGRVVLDRDAAFASQTRVFPANPVTTPEPIDVELTTLTVDAAGLPMSSPLFDVFGCGAESPDPPPPWWNEGDCLPLARALSDASGDWFAPLPDVGRIADNRAFDDPYAEVAAYHYVEKFFDVMHARGLVGARCDRFTVHVNRHTIGDDGEPISQGGAFFVDDCDPDQTPTLMVGQGKDVDYAWDSDTLFHELGHSVVQQLSPEGLVDRRHAEWGIVSEAGAINEGLGDYFAMTINGDPEVAEYIGRIDVSSGTPFLRSGDNDARCPDDLIGGWHSDGRIVSGALWSVRSRLGIVVDELVMRALTVLPPDAILTDFGGALHDVGAQLLAEGTLDEPGFALLERELTTRGLLECVHVIDDPELAKNGKKMELVASEDLIVPLAPGPFQLRVRVPQHAEQVTLFVTADAEGDDPAAVSFLVKHADAPIEFGYEIAEADELVTVSGDWDVELVGEALNDTDFIAHLAVEPGEVLHVALANRSATKVSASSFFVAPSAPFGDAGGDGCGCGSPSSDAPAGLLLSIVLGAPRRRR